MEQGQGSSEEGVGEEGWLDEADRVASLARIPGELAGDAEGTAVPIEE